MPHAAQHHHREDHDRLEQAEGLGADEALHCREQAACNAAGEGTEGKRRQLDVAHIDAHRLGGDVVLPERLPGATEPRMLEVVDDDDRQHREEEEHEVIELQPGDGQAKDLDALPHLEAEEVEPLDAGDAAGSVREVVDAVTPGQRELVEVVHEDPDDLAETQGDDRKIVAAQTKHRIAEQEPGDPREEGPQRNEEPKRQAHPEVGRGEERPGVRPYRIEGHIAEVKQTGDTDHDVEAQRQHHVQQRDVEDAHPRLTEHAGEERQDQEHDADRHDGDQLLLAVLQEITHPRLLTRARPRARRSAPAAGRSARARARRRRRCPCSPRARR